MADGRGIRPIWLAKTIGGTMLGWHDRSKPRPTLNLPRRSRRSDKNLREAMGIHQGRDYLLTKPARTAVLRQGYIRGDQDFYEMQTQ